MRSIFPPVLPTFTLSSSSPTLLMLPGVFISPQLAPDLELSSIFHPVSHFMNYDDLIPSVIDKGIENRVFFLSKLYILILIIQIYILSPILYSISFHYYI